MREGKEDVITIDSGSDSGRSTDSIEIINEHREDVGTVPVDESQPANVEGSLVANVEESQAVAAGGAQAGKPVAKRSFGQVRIGGASPEPVVAIQMQGLPGADVCQSPFDYGDSGAIYQPPRFSPAIQQVQSPRPFRRYFQHTDEARRLERGMSGGMGRKRRYTRWDGDATTNQPETPQFDVAMGGAIPRDQQQDHLWTTIDEHMVAGTQGKEAPIEHVPTSDPQDTDPPGEDGAVATEGPTADNKRVDPRETAQPIDPMALMRSAFKRT